MAQVIYPERDVAVGSHDVIIHNRLSEGNIITYINATERLGDYSERLFDKLYEYAKKYPNRTLVAQRELNPITGKRENWIKLTYSDVLEKSRNIAQALIKYNLSSERPLMILSENSLEVFLLIFGSMIANIPHTLIAPAYSLLAESPDKLKYVIDKLTPGAFYAGDGHGFLKHLEACGQINKPIITTTGTVDNKSCIHFDELIHTKATDEVELIHQNINADSIVKFLFTSGSTGDPKVVPTTHRMLCSNQQMLQQSLCLNDNKPPVLVDWLSWHHTFGGSHNIGIAVYNAGTIYIDEGKPVPGKFDETIRNLKEISPSKYFNVPIGWEMLANALEEDERLRNNFFKNVDLFFFAGASLSQDLLERLGAISYKHCGEKIRVMAGLGMTETSPSCTFTTGPSNTTANFIGFPAPGVEIKLVPFQDKLELRIRGPHVMKGYWRHEPDDISTIESFDEEGFYCTGDAVAFYNHDDHHAGLVYDGRISEDFKLVTGTFVNVSELRSRILLQGHELIDDIVITGEGRHEVGALVYIKEKAARRMTGLADSDTLSLLKDKYIQYWFESFIKYINNGYHTSSKRIERIYLMQEPASITLGEKTDKGTLNQRKIRNNKTIETEALYDDKPDILRFIAP